MVVDREVSVTKARIRHVSIATAAVVAADVTVEVAATISSNSRPLPPS
jgi:hypothetical protein